MRAGVKSIPRSSNTALHSVSAWMPAGAPLYQVSWMINSTICSGVNPTFRALLRCRFNCTSRFMTMRRDSVTISRCTGVSAGRFQMVPKSASPRILSKSGAMSHAPGVGPG